MRPPESSHMASARRKGSASSRKSGSPWPSFHSRSPSAAASTAAIAARSRREPGVVAAPRGGTAAAGGRAPQHEVHAVAAHESLVPGGGALGDERALRGVETQATAAQELELDLDRGAAQQNAKPTGGEGHHLDLAHAVTLAEG